ncbi:MAG TPA: hypothetical protein VGQ52_02805, partial [Gemmatimonadaceae bacterium]|nr:hypothetical protein [Gemmatimonadaceae bacterium]
RHDASDADAAVVRMQRARDTGPIRWHRIDAAGSVATVLDDAIACLKRRANQELPLVGQAP